MEGDICYANEPDYCINFITCVIKQGETQGVCQHDGLFPMYPFQILAYVLIPFIVGISNVGGIGGGIVKVPILVLMLNYTTAQATNISYPITLGGCLANIFLLLREKHPTQDKPLIEFGIAMILVPAILLGTNTGVLMNNVMPEIFLNGFFIVFLCLVCPYLMKRGCGLLNLEMKVRKELKEIQKDLNNESVLTQDIQIAEIEKEIMESENGDLKKSILSQNPKIERYHNAVENLKKSVAERNSYFFDKQELKEYRNSSMMRVSGFKERSKSQIQYTQFATQLAKKSNVSEQGYQIKRSASINDIEIKQYTKYQKRMDIEINDDELLTEENIKQRKMDKLNAKIIKETDLSLVPEQSIEQSMTMQNTDQSVIQNSDNLAQQIQQIKKIEEADSRKETDNFFNEDDCSDTLIKKQDIIQKQQLQQQNTDITQDIQQDNQKIERNNSVQPIVYTDKQIETKDQILLQESKIAPLPKILFLIFCLAVVSLFAFILGGNSIFGFQRCDTGYWIFFTLQYFCLIGLSLAAWFYMRKELNLKHSCHYDFDENDIQKLDLKSYLKLSGAGATAGFIAGMLGAGAGLVVVPVLLILNVHTRVAAATSGFMYFFISWASILTVITGGQLSPEEIGWYTMLALLGGALISPVIYWLVNKYKRHSIVIFIVFFIAFLNIVCSILYLFKASGINGFDYLLQFHDYCKATH